VKIDIFNSWQPGMGPETQIILHWLGAPGEEMNLLEKTEMMPRHLVTVGRNGRPSGNLNSHPDNLKPQN
jgi:hypothetical protein